MQTFGLIGFPLGHSFSTKYFTTKFYNEGLTECQYLNFEINDIELIKGIVSNTPSLQGFNVTIPYKQAIIPYLNKLSEEATQIGAVNCVKITEQGWIGYNTDMYGFKSSLLTLIGDYRPSALVLGNGGASKAVCYALGVLGIEHLVVSRGITQPNCIDTTSDNITSSCKNTIQTTDHQQINSLNREPQTQVITYDQLTTKITSEHKLIINCTPLGTYPKIEGLPAIPYEAITNQHYLFDLVYNPPLTAFLHRGMEQGAHICNGHDMLRLQADKSWEIWHSL